MILRRLTKTQKAEIVEAYRAGENTNEIAEKYDSLLSLSPTHRFNWEINGRETIPKYDFKKRPRRQDIPESERSYIENGSLYIFTYNNFMKYNNRLGGKIGHIIFEEEFSFEIDSLTDLIVIDSIAKKIK